MQTIQHQLSALMHRARAALPVIGVAEANAKSFRKMTEDTALEWSRTVGHNFLDFWNRYRNGLWKEPEFYRRVAVLIARVFWRVLKRIVSIVDWLFAPAMIVQLYTRHFVAMVVLWIIWRLWKVSAFGPRAERSVAFALMLTS